MATRLFIRRERTRGVQSSMKRSPIRRLHCGVDKQQVTGIKWQMFVIKWEHARNCVSILAIFFGKVRLMYQLTIKGNITNSAKNPIYSIILYECDIAQMVISPRKPSPERGLRPYIGLT